MFKFYRPVTQASFAIELAIHGDRPAVFRAVNVALHAGVIAMALVVARLVLIDPLSAALAAIAFALTPKAPAIAALWISGRAELLMALFALGATAAWIRWSRGGAPYWLATAIAAYVLAAASKETAFLLPLLLVFTPGQHRSRAATSAAIGTVVVLGALLFAWRSHIGALTPLSEDSHYGLLTGLARVVRSLQNYLARMIGAPLVLVALLIAARVIELGRRGRSPGSVGVLTSVLLFPLLWTMVLLAPVLPIVARSELYLYLPVFGLCLLTGVFGGLAQFGVAQHRAMNVAVALFIVALGGYQITRAAAMHDDLAFSAALVDALRADGDLAAGADAIALIPADEATERHLRDSIGGYLYAVLRRAFPDGQVTGVTQYAGMTVTGATRRVLCRYVDRRIVLTYDRGRPPA